MLSYFSKKHGVPIVRVDAPAPGALGTSMVCTPIMTQTIMHPFACVQTFAVPIHVPSPVPAMLSQLEGEAAGTKASVLPTGIDSVAAAHCVRQDTALYKAGQSYCVDQLRQGKAMYGHLASLPLSEVFSNVCDD